MSISAPGGVSAPTDPSRVRFLAFLLDDLSRGLLLAHVHELGVADDDGWTTHADHVTFAHTPSAEQLASFPWGVPCEMEVVGFACDERCRAVQVDVPSWVPVHPQVAVPHITVSCAPGARAMESDAMLAHKMALGEIMFTREFLPLTLRGRFGGVTMSDARVFAQPGVMDAATRTAVAAVVQADAAADAADAAAARAAARRAEAEKEEARALSMRLAEEKLGEVELSSRFAGLEELEEQDVHTHEAVTVAEPEPEPEPKDAASGSGSGSQARRLREKKTTCETCGKKHAGRCWHETNGDGTDRAFKRNDEFSMNAKPVKPLCETCGKRHRGWCRHESSNGASLRTERDGGSGRDEENEEKRKGKAPAYAPGRDDTITSFGSASARDSRDSRDSQELELEGLKTNGPSVSRANNSGANDEDDVDFTEAELLLRELGFADSGARAGANDAADDRRVASEGSREMCLEDTTRDEQTRGRRLLDDTTHASRQKLASLFPDVPEQVIDDALRACDGNANAAASRFVRGHVPESVPAYGCIDADVSSRASLSQASTSHQTRGTYCGTGPSHPRGSRRRAGKWYPRAEAWARENATADGDGAFERLEREVSGGMFEWERAGRHRERERDAEAGGDPTAEDPGGVARFYGRGADVPGAFAGGSRAGHDRRRPRAPSASDRASGFGGGGAFSHGADASTPSAPALLPGLDIVRLKQRKMGKTEAKRQSDEHRREADVLFAARARFAGLAQGARARGDGRAAKDFFARAEASAAQAYGHKAKAQQLAHVHYNDGTRGGMEETDLHGAEVGVATDKVTRVLSAVSELKMSALKVIYGQGKNSEMGRAKVGPAVREFLAGQHIAFTEAQDGGSLIVPLS